MVLLFGFVKKECNGTHSIQYHSSNQFFIPLIRGVFNGMKHINNTITNLPVFFLFHHIEFVVLLVCILILVYSGATCEGYQNNHILIEFSWQLKKYREGDWSHWVKL